MKTTFRACATALVGAALLLPLAALAADPAPMPQTRGMAGMDPKLHDQWEQQRGQDPYKDCVVSADARAQQARHPMPQTKGMAGMDPKLHTVSCPQNLTATPPRHGPRN